MNPEVIKFIAQYRSEFPLSYWDTQTKTAIRLAKLAQKRLLTTDEKIELYTNYIQLLEITIIVMRCFTDDINQFMQILFKSDQILMQTIDNLIDSDQLKTNISMSVFNVRTPASIKKHSELLKSVLEDYKADRGLLNSYKHGFRVKGGKPFANIEVEVSPDEWKSIGTLENVIAYSEREMKKNRMNIIEREIGFIPEVLVHKLRFTHLILTNLIKQEPCPYLAKVPKTPDLTFIRGKHETLSFTFSKSSNSSKS